jgi:hypothetical protein
MLDRAIGVDHALDLRSTLFWPRMRPEVVADCLDRNPGCFFLRRPRARPAGRVGLALECFEHSDRTGGRVSRGDRNACPLAVGFQFLLLRVTSLKELDRELRELAGNAKVQLAKRGFHLKPLDTVSLVYVLDLMAKYGGQLIFRIHQVEHSCSDEDVSARQSKRVNKRWIWDVMESVRQWPATPKSELVADLLDVPLDRKIVGPEIVHSALGYFVSCCDLFFV